MRVDLGDDGVLAARYGNDAELQSVGRGLGYEFAELHVDHRRGLLDLEYGHLELSVREIHGVGGCGMLELVRDLLRRDLLGEEHQVEAHLLEQQFVLGGEELLVFQSCRDFFGSYFLG